MSHSCNDIQIMILATSFFRSDPHYAAGVGKQQRAVPDRPTDPYRGSERNHSPFMVLTLNDLKLITRLVAPLASLYLG
jgi:hypothetical protein